MIEEFPNTTDAHSNSYIEKSSSNSYYDPINESVDYARFVEDIRTSVGVDRDKVVQYLSNDLLSIQKDSPLPISYSDTSDDNVRLMQEKLADLGSSETPLRNQSFLSARSLTISTFRALQIMLPVVKGFRLRVQNPEEILETIVSDQLLKQTTKKTDTFDESDMREPVMNTNNVLISSSLDAFARENKIPVNENGKVTSKEIGTIVLPTVRKLIMNIARRTPAFKK